MMGRGVEKAFSQPFLRTLTKILLGEKKGEANVLSTVMAVLQDVLEIETCLHPRSDP